MRLEVPAASTTPATEPALSPRMDRSLLRAQRPRFARRANRKKLGDDGERALLGALSAQIETHRAEDTIARGRADLAQELGSARPGPDDADIRNPGRQQLPHPLPVV